MENNTPVTKAELQSLLQNAFDQALRRLEEYIGERSDRLKLELTEYIDERTERLKGQLTEYIDERTHDAETRLLRAFSDYQTAETIRFRHMKADIGNLNTATDERLAEIERRISEIDKRLIAKNI